MAQWLRAHATPAEQWLRVSATPAEQWLRARATPAEQWLRARATPAGDLRSVPSTHTRLLGTESRASMPSSGL